MYPNEPKTYYELFMDLLHLGYNLKGFPQHVEIYKGNELIETFDACEDEDSGEIEELFTRLKKKQLWQK